MEKRVLIAFGLSLSVLLLWSAFFVKPTPKITPAQPKEQIVLPPENKVEDQSALVTATFDGMDVVFVENQASVKEVTFPSYKSGKFTLKNAFLMTDNENNFHTGRITSDSIEFVSESQDKKIIKQFFYKSKYNIYLEITIENKTKQPLRVNPALLLGTLNFSSSQPQPHYAEITAALVEKTIHPNPKKDGIYNQLKFMGLKDRYFCLVLEPAGEGYSGFVKKISNNESESGVSSKEIVILPGEKITQQFKAYLGPQDIKILANNNPVWASVVYYGNLDLIAQMLSQLLYFLHNIFKNWGLTLIGFSILVYFLLYPLTLKQIRSMKEMQSLQPKIEQLRVTHKDNPQRMNKEIFELYKTHKVNPYSGCLPLLLQIPIFFALYQVLIRSVALKGAQFLWIKDLSEPDRLITFNNSPIPFITELNLLPILMVIATFIQQKYSNTNSSAISNEQQKIFAIIFPIMFGFIFYKMPSGLVLYWFVNNLLMLASQMNLHRKNAA
ncbi:MAG: membrane protein insertase YidC [Candidatus Omnitrophica bacterium]|nr:membrane protein insertase YidC [Candidatus Omnitrophota bacterium]